MCFRRHAFEISALYPYTIYTGFRECRCLISPLERIIFCIILDSQFIHCCARRWFLGMLCIFRAQNQCLLLSKHRFTSWVARRKRAPPFFYIRVRVNSVQARINVFVVFFCTWVTRKVEAPERTKRKHCTIMCASIALVNFSFFFFFHSAFL